MAATISSSDFPACIADDINASDIASFDPS